MHSRRKHLQHRAREREAERVILLAGVAQPRAVERQRVDRFQRPRLKLLHVVIGDRRPAQHIAREQRRDADRMPRRAHLERHIPIEEQIKKAGMVALPENQLSGSKSLPPPS